MLRQEYRQLEQQLGDYDRLREERGQRQAQLAATQEEWDLLQKLHAESQELAQALAEGDYAPGIAEELASVEEQLAVLNYDERELALARGRWNATLGGFTECPTGAVSATDAAVAGATTGVRSDGGGPGAGSPGVG